MQKNKMKYSYFLCSLFSCTLFLLSSCSNAKIKNKFILKDISPTSSSVVQIVKSSIRRSDKKVSQENTDAFFSSESELSSLVPRDYSIISVKWANLDLDDIEEAVVVVTKKEQNFVNVLIAKFDAGSEKYFFLWQETTNIISSSFISLNIYDLNFDRKKEIVLEGSNENLQQHLIVFHLDDPQYNIRNYKEKFSKSGIGGGDIELQLARDSFSSASIVVYNIYEEKEIIEKQSYIWTENNANFVLFKNDIFSFQDQAEERVNTLNTRDPDVWLHFLNGLWIYEDELPDSNRIENTPPVALFFSKHMPQLTLIKNASMKFYQWSDKTSRMFRSNIGIQVRISNLILPSIFASLSIEVLSEKKINIKLTRDEYSEEITGVFIQVDSNDAIYNDFPLFSEQQMSRKKQIVQDWFIGNKKDVQAGSTYLFSSDTVSIFTFNNNTEYAYKLFTIATDFFIEIKKENEILFYKLENIRELFTNNGTKEVNIRLDPYVITSTKVYPVENVPSLILITQGT